MRLPLTDFPTQKKKILAFFNPQVIVMRKITKKKGLFFIKTDCRIYGCICFELEDGKKNLCWIFCYGRLLLLVVCWKFVWQNNQICIQKRKALIQLLLLWNWRKWKSLIEFMISVISEKKVQINFLPHHKKEENPRLYCIKISSQPSFLVMYDCLHYRLV